MIVNARVEVVQWGDPARALRNALQKFRRQCSPVMHELRKKEFFVSESRQRREAARKAAFDRKVHATEK